MMSSEELFLRYSFPCAHVLLDMGKMRKERYSELERCAKNGKPVSRNVLEASFPAAFRRLEELAKEMKIENYWDIRVMKEYWHKRHNKFIDNRDGNYAKFPEFFCDYCKVHVAEIIKILPKGFLLIEYNKTKRLVSGDYISNAKIKDKVRIHHAYAIEKFEG
jgi:hypothetical protein